MPGIVAEVPQIKCLHLIIDSVEVFNVQNMLLISHSSTVHLAQGTPLVLGYLCDNIELVLACLPNELQLSLDHLAGI